MLVTAARCGWCKRTTDDDPVPFAPRIPHLPTCPEAPNGFRYVTQAVDLAGVPWEDSYHRRPADAHEQAEALMRGRSPRRFHAMVGDARDGERGWLDPDDVCPDCGMEWPDTARCPSCGLTIETVAARAALEGSRA